MPLYLVSALVEQGDKNSLLVRENFGDRYDDHYMKKTREDDDWDDDYDENVVIDDDAPGKRMTVQILCISVGLLGVRPYPSTCEVIVVGSDVFVAGYDEYHKCFL